MSRYLSQGAAGEVISLLQQRFDLPGRAEFKVALYLRRGHPIFSRFLQFAAVIDRRFYEVPACQPPSFLKLGERQLPIIGLSRSEETVKDARSAPAKRVEDP